MKESCDGWLYRKKELALTVWMSEKWIFKDTKGPCDDYKCPTCTALACPDPPTSNSRQLSSVEQCWSAVEAYAALDISLSPPPCPDLSHSTRHLRVQTDLSHSTRPLTHRSAGVEGGGGGGHRHTTLDTYFHVQTHLSQIQSNSPTLDRWVELKAVEQSPAHTNSQKEQVPSTPSGTKQNNSQVIPHRPIANPFFLNLFFPSITIVS